MRRFVLMHKSIALPALQISLEALRWTDGEAVTKVSSFCGAVILLAISTTNMELRDFVCKDLFPATIQALALESNAFISADLVALCREIFIYLADKHRAPRQVIWISHFSVAYSVTLCSLQFFFQDRILAIVLIHLHLFSPIFIILVSGNMCCTFIPNYCYITYLYLKLCQKIENA